jgi:aryl-alcohol dehydrogenase-like predicted oxidoreductase
LINRAVEAGQLPWCEANYVGVIVYSPMGSGLLTGAMTKERVAKLPQGDWRRNNPEFQEPKLSKNLALAERLRVVAERHGRTPGQAAVAWTLRLPVVTGAIVGARNAAQVEGVMGAGDWRLTPEEIAEVEG